MDTASFDALATGERLREAGFDEPRAEAAAALETRLAVRSFGRLPAVGGPVATAVELL